MATLLLLVDGNSLMHRAFHALPLLDNGAGVYTNAVFGFLSMLLKVVREEAPTYCAVAFDLHEPTFRHKAYEEYKAGRAPTPDELRPQFAVLRELLSAMHVYIATCEGYEADDLLGTLSRKAAAQGVDSLLITGDRDAFQLADEHTQILYTKRGITDTERVTPAYLMDKYGLTPAQMIDLKGLMGDSSDNIPGVPGVGEKTALKLLHEFGTLEETLARAEATQKGKLKERLLTYADQARFSKYLATIERDAPAELSLEDARLRDLRDGLPVLYTYGLKTIAQRVEALDAGDGADAAPAAAPSPDLQKPVICQDTAALETWAKAAADTQRVSVACDAANVSAALSNGAQAVIALGGDLLTPGTTEEDALRALMPLLTSPIPKDVHDVKSMLRAADIPPSGVFDILLAAYLVNPQRKSFSLEALLSDTPDAADQTPAAKLRLCADSLRETLARDGLTALYDEVELPLAYALRDMERVGFAVDEAVLRSLGASYRAKIDALTDQIRAIAGYPINVNSPKQLAVLLFDELALGDPKSKSRSTDAETLEALADRHAVVPLILEYRKYAKLNGTYIDPLLRLRDGNGRVHTSFDQTATATGRISSLEPNLQNIPVRTELGREIRSAFVAEPGYLLIDADYSQIELRVLAHMSEDEVMREAFRLGQDIHARTAAEVYGVPLESVTRSMRSAAKAVNFGIVYGISDFGLARNIGVSRREASEFIQRYFERYPGVKRFMERMKALGAAQGYVTTMLGRRRYLPELHSPAYTVRAFGERAAMNSPVQGTAADIIKVAMVAADRALRQRLPRARLILQVHDELIVEAPTEDADAAADILRDAMMNAARLSVPLVVDLSMGGNWNACKA